MSWALTQALTGSPVTASVTRPLMVAVSASAGVATPTRDEARMLAEASTRNTRDDKGSPQGMRPKGTKRLPERARTYGPAPHPATLLTEPLPTGGCRADLHYRRGRYLSSSNGVTWLR